jgi:hypothetical protein
MQEMGHALFAYDENKRGRQAAQYRQARKAQQRRSRCSNRAMAARVECRHVMFDTPQDLTQQPA